MGSVEFSDSYRTVALGYPTNYVRINFTELEYDSATNRTKIRLDGVYLKSSLNIGSSAVYGTLKIAGTTLLTMSGGSYQCSINTSYNLVSYSGNNAIVWVQHNNDGTASMSVSLTGGKANDDNNNVFGGYVGIMSGKAVFGVRTTATKNVSLTTRPRGSTITSSTANAATNGAFSLVMDRKDSSYYHIATFSYGDDVLFTSAQFDTSLNFTVPRSWFADYPSLASIPVTVSVQTYNSGGTAIGSPATASLTVAADADMKPSVSSGWATVVPYNVGGVAGFAGYVKNYSKAEATFDATKIDMTNAVGASIASYSVTCQGETASASPYRTPTFASTSVSVVCTVTDTRGRTASETFALTVMDYSAPVLTGQTVFRCDSLGVADEDGQYFSVKAVLSYSSVGGQNSCSLKCAAAAAGGTYGTETSMTSGTASVIGQYSADTTYTVRIRAQDTIGNTAEWTITIPTREWAVKFRPNGRGVAFGKAAETDAVFEIADGWAVKSRGIVDLIYPVGSLYLSVGSASPAVLFGGTWEQIRDRFLLAAGDSFSAGETGGAAAHRHTTGNFTLTVNEIPSHYHKASNYKAISGWEGDSPGYFLSDGRQGSSTTTGPNTGSTGGGRPHNHGDTGDASSLPPYLAVYIWKRTA